MKIVHPVAILLVAAASLTAASSAGAQSADSSVRLLDVSFIQQTEALCGGAAAAMVMRFWGATGVDAASFSSLVDEKAGGIRAEHLLRDLHGRGWRAQSFRGDRTVVAGRLADRQPVVALIEDRPGVFHFVVIVAWVNDRVVYHDPARAPFRVIDEADFEAAWEKADRWTLLLLPPAAGVPAPPDASTAASTTVKKPCDDLVAEGMRKAERGETAAAREAFTAAAELCPGESGPLREAAGLSALDADWIDAERLARAAVARDPSDLHAWRIVATSAYLRDDVAAALEAWNHAGEPLIDLVTVTGLNRTRHAVANGLMGLDVGTPLTMPGLAAARRRLHDLPSADLARVSYTPLGGGRASVEALVVERPLLPTTRESVMEGAIRLATDREVAGHLASPSGNGELLRVAWRWWAHRPRAEVVFSVPSRAGVWRMTAFAERQTYGALEDEVVEKRRGGYVSLSRWTSTATRWEVGAGVDTWDRQARTIGVTAAVDQRLSSDRVSIRLDATILGGAFAARTAAIGMDWRSHAESQGLVLLAGGGWSAATPAAPRALWPGAGTGHGRDVYLRAHPLLDGGRIDADVFGRSIVHGSAEARRWLGPVLKVLRIAPAVFVDIARAERRLHPGSAWHADAGAGIRIAVPGSGVLRLDVGKGLRDGATAVSLGWTR